MVRGRFFLPLALQAEGVGMGRVGTGGRLVRLRQGLQTPGALPHSFHLLEIVLWIVLRNSETVLRVSSSGL